MWKYFSKGFSGSPGPPVGSRPCATCSRLTLIGRTFVFGDKIPAFSANLQKEANCHVTLFSCRILLRDVGPDRCRPYRNKYSECKDDWSFTHDDSAPNWFLIHIAVTHCYELESFFYVIRNNSFILRLWYNIMQWKVSYRKITTKTKHFKELAEFNNVDYK